MRRQFNKLALVLVISLVFTSGVYAGATNEQVKVLLNREVKITYNGELQELKDFNGERVYPLTYNGSTYLPARAICDMTGTGVDWDGKTNTVLLGELNNKEALLVDREKLESRYDTVYNYVVNDTEELSYDIDGDTKEFETGIAFTTMLIMESDLFNHVKLFDAKGYKELEFTLGAKGGKEKNAQLFIYNQDGEVISKDVISKGELKRKVIKLRDVSKIGFGSTGLGAGGFYDGTVYVYDPILK